MKLRIRALQIRIEAENGIFGCDMTFGDGLVLLRADNTKGKSTCLMSVLYALGLEGMLGPQHQPPLPPVVLSQIVTDEGPKRVLSSYVRVEIDGDKGTATVKRTIADSPNGRQRISVVLGPDLTKPSTEYASKDFFIRTKGDTLSELGFHTFLADFIGWKLPTLTKFDGSPTVLYLACLAPFFFVDQLSGWRDIKARMPTYLQIPEMAKRSTEFLLSLDILRIAIIHLELREQEEALKKRWHEMRVTFKASLPRIGIVPRGLPENMPQEGEPPNPQLLILAGEIWTPFEDYAAATRNSLKVLMSREVPTVATASPEAVSLLRKLETDFALTLRRFEERQVEVRLARDQVRAVAERLRALREDFQQYDDDRRLRDRGGKVPLRVTDNSCPTCGQHINGILLPEDATQRLMSLEENIAFLRDQIATFREMESDARRTLEGKEQAATAMATQVDDLSARVRAQKELLRSQPDSPSVADVQNRLLLEARVAQIEQAEDAWEELLKNLERFMADWEAVQKARRLAGPERLTNEDEGKLKELEGRFIAQLNAYGFESYDIAGISIGRDTYRPSNEGVDLGITSASDAIRVVWAYLLGLMETARTKNTNHPGLLVFDEPKQQMVKNISFRALMRRAVESASAGQQIIFGTSQPKVEIIEMLQGLKYEMWDFEDARIIGRIPDTSTSVAKKS